MRDANKNKLIKFSVEVVRGEVIERICSLLQISYRSEMNNITLVWVMFSVKLPIRAQICNTLAIIIQSGNVLSKSQEDTSGRSGGYQRRRRTGFENTFNRGKSSAMNIGPFTKTMRTAMMNNSSSKKKILPGEANAKEKRQDGIRTTKWFALKKKLKHYNRRGSIKKLDSSINKRPQNPHRAPSRA
ncbi:unnamed protein product [Trichogramma brassicae]|uniref:Uncharacterized protein n=1 Tax=Trichogramma brassicae TaxID=86971 RepID=A0A6H5IPJ7_9HYME|nr:unnamed protein product [Trichogramma brassicae]